MLYFLDVRFSALGNQKTTMKVAAEQQTLELEPLFPRHQAG
jgi:hypothetical protein